MNDALGKKLFIGDLVGYADKCWRRGRRVVMIGKVKRFGKKQVVISYKNDLGNGYTSNRYPEDIVKYDSGGNNE